MMDFHGPRKKPKEESWLFEEDSDAFGLEEEELLYLLDEECEIEENDE
jgi:hypothetical protein